ncbi:MAG: amidohydrolase family protein [bacterium]|nr:amidohydrolase family protein [bacterium]
MPTLVSRATLLRATLLCLFSALSLSLSLAHADAPAGERGGPGLALRAAKVVTAAMDGPLVIDHGIVLVANGKIEAVGRARDVEIPDGYELVDCGSRWLMPGLIELHNHIGTPSAFFPNDINDTVYLANPGLRVSPGVVPRNLLLQRGVAGGVTSALFIPGSGSNMGGQGILFKLGHDTFETMRIRDPGSLKLAQAGNPERWTIQPGRAFQNWNTRNTFKRGLAYARRFEAALAQDGEVPAKDPQWEIFRALHAREVQVSTHTQWHQVVLATIRIVRQELGLDVFIDHGSFDGYKAGGVAADEGVPAILGPRMISNTYFSPTALFGLMWNDTDGAIVGIAAEYQKRGHKMIGFNTDCVDGGALNLTPPQEELSLQAAMAVRYGLENFDLESIKGLTIVPAITCGLGERIGSLEVGKDADIVVLTGDVADPRTWVETVYTDGKRVYDAKRDGRLW